MPLNVISNFAANVAHRHLSMSDAAATNSVAKLSAGTRVLTAKDGTDALDQLEEGLPDVILSDIEMPRMDGFEFVRNLRADERMREVPVIMITSRLADKHRDYAQKLGANEYLGKPYDEDELLRLIDRYVRAGATH